MSSETQNKEVTLGSNRAQNVELADRKATVITSNKRISNVYESEASALIEGSNLEKLDEITSLEREIAELHHVEPTRPSGAQKVKNGDDISMREDTQREKVLEMQSQQRNSRPSSVGSDVEQQTIIVNDSPENALETLEEEDLIAVLKGVGENEHSNEKAEGQEGNDDELTAVGVTIEGEGEFQIMEIDDDDVEDADGTDPGTGNGKATLSGGTKPKTYSNTVQKHPKEMTKEEERHLALEQIQGLKASRKENKNRRRQDIKPIPLETTDLVSVLGADWSEDEIGVESQESASAASRDTKTTESISNSKTTGKEYPSKSSTTVAVCGDEKAVEKNKQRKTPPTITSVVLLKCASKDLHVNVAKSDVEATGKGKNKDSDTTTSAVQPQTTGFKRTRIIKRKIIWDPDAPETTFSYAQLVRPSNTSNVTKIKNETPSGKTSASSPTISLMKKEPAQKKVRPVTPKDRKLAAERNSTLTVTTDTKAQRAATPKLSTKTFSAGPVGAVAVKQTTTAQQSKHLVESGAVSPVKRRSQTPVANGASKKKKVSELDRLMGDEGAVNMLNSLECERQKAAECSDLPKCNMRSRSATISEKFIKRDLTPVKREGAVVAKPKRIQKPKASATWDYVYKQQASEDAMIIRRRSNSSYSSSTSLQRLSLDSTKSQTKTAAKVTKASQPLKSANKPKTSNTTSDTSFGDTSVQSTNNSPTDKAFEFAKPESKSNQKSRKIKSPQTTNPLASDMKKASANSAANRRAVRSPATVDEKEKSTTKSPINAGKDEAALSGVLVRRLGKVAQIIFNTSKSKIDYTFNLDLLNNFVDALTKLSTDTDCHAVVITTNAPNFCQGIDFTELTVGSLEKRKKTANQMGVAVKNFLQTLATFPKPLIAGVNGSNVGLGVTMLALFDIVVASEKGSYETPYAKIGQVPEGYCIWNALSKIRGTFKTKLFLLCEKLHSTESALSGLVNKLTAPNKVNDDAIATAKRIASLSVESYRCMKKTSIEANEDLFSTALELEFKTISEQWSSEECFENMKKFIQLGSW